MRHGSKKNRKRIFKQPKTGRLFIGAEESTKLLETQLINAFKIAKWKQKIDCIECDINAQIVFYFPKSIFYTQKNVRSAKVADISNLYQSVEDALQKSEVIKNDSQIESHDGSRRRPIDGSEYWLEVVLSRSTL